MKKKLKPKLRVPIAPPTQRHKSKKDYDRKSVKKPEKETDEKIDTM